VSDNDDSENGEEVDVALPSISSSIFTEVETKGIYERLVYEKRLKGTYTKTTTIWPSLDAIRDMVGSNTGAAVIGRTELTQCWEEEMITVTALAYEIVHSSTVEETYLNHLRGIKLTLKVDNLSRPHVTDKSDLGDESCVIKIRGEEVSVRGEHRASGEFASGQFWSMETFVHMGYQKNLRIDVQHDDTLSRWHLRSRYLRNIKEQVFLWCAARIGNAITKKAGGFTYAPIGAPNLAPLFNGFFDEWGATYGAWKESGKTCRWTSMQRKSYESLSNKCTLDEEHLEDHRYGANHLSEVDSQHSARE
jgi:hypothetical protein